MYSGTRFLGPTAPTNGCWEAQQYTPAPERDSETASLCVAPAARVAAFKHVHIPVEENRHPERGAPQVALLERSQRLDRLRRRERPPQGAQAGVW